MPLTNSGTDTAANMPAESAPSSSRPRRSAAATPSASESGTPTSKVSSASVTEFPNRPAIFRLTLQSLPVVSRQ